MILVTFDTEMCGAKTVEDSNGTAVSAFELNIVGTMRLAVLKIDSRDVSFRHKYALY